MVHRREFLGAAAAALATAGLEAQAPSWPSPVLDNHFHMRRELEANTAHLDGCGVTSANLLTQAARPTAFTPSRKSTPAALSGSPAPISRSRMRRRMLTRAIKSGAVGFGEMKFHVEADGPEFRRVYALAAELNVPILIHFQEVPHTPTEGVFATGFKNFEAILKAYPKTRFIGHADAFWANISAGL